MLLHYSWTSGKSIFNSISRLAILFLPLHDLVVVSLAFCDGAQMYVCICVITGQVLKHELLAMTTSRSLHLTAMSSFPSRSQKYYVLTLSASMCSYAFPLFINSFRDYAKRHTFTMFTLLVTNTGTNFTKEKANPVCMCRWARVCASVFLCISGGAPLSLLPSTLIQSLLRNRVK